MMLQCSPILLALAFFSTVAAVGESGGLRLVPYPKEVKPLSGEFSLLRPLFLDAPEAELEMFARALNGELKRAGRPSAQVRAIRSPGLVWRLTVGGSPGEPPALPSGENPEAYALDVRSDEIVCAGREAMGLHYGLQTLCQLIRANRRADALTCLNIRDWPSLRWRCFQDDLTRGPSSKLQTLEFEASLAASLKLNLMTYYMESQFAFLKHPQIGPSDGSLTPEDLSALVAYAKSIHLDILGNQQSFGHFGQILKHPQYSSLRETSDVLTPANEETYRLLDDLYAEVCPRLPFPWFNVCCDETDGLGTGPAGQLASEIGVGGVYVRHIRRVHDLLQNKHGKRMMMWGDIILQHPDKLDQVPKDTIMLTWGYDARASWEDRIAPFAKSGYEFFVCPGVNNWSRILPDFGVAVTNIQNFVRDGVKLGALGMLNTDWEDDGEAINAVKWHADAWAAECAWNGSTTPFADFNRRVGAVLFGESGDSFGRAVDLLTRTHRLAAMKGMFNSRFWEQDFVPKGKAAAIQSAATDLLAVVEPALRLLEQCKQEARCHEPVLDAYLFGARRMQRIGQRMLDGLEAVQRYEKAYQLSASWEAMTPIEALIRKNRDAHEALGREFASLWLAENRSYALDWTMGRYTNVVKEYDALLQRVASAAAEVRSGRRLPAPEEIGLALPKPVARLLKPREIQSIPLEPTMAWADTTATHRVGLTIHAGVNDRFHLPVEVEITVPPALVSKPVRAFVAKGKGQGRELLAQLDPSGDSGASRLLLVLDDPLPKGQEISIHVYLGLSQTPVPLPGAVSTRKENEGKYWIENDRIRALVGAEGAHVYRWEVKSAENRDLTMPGEGGWAGFSDIGSQRHSTYRLSCAGQGPAMAEFRCVGAVGDEKTVRVYGGADWMEVLLDESTSLYWDFDNPSNFAADGPTPGTWLFSDGKSGQVGREADGVSAQVEAAGTSWSVKYNPNHLALGLITPETSANHRIGPGAGAGGVGIESSPPAQHFVTFAGVLEKSPAETMNRLQSTLDLKRPVSVSLHGLQAR